MKKVILYITVSSLLLLLNSCRNNNNSQNNEQSQSDSITEGEVQGTDITTNEIDMKIKSGEYFDLITENYEGKEKLLSYIEQEKKREIKNGETFLLVPYSVESLPLILPVTSICLRKAGYIPPTESDYQRQISKYFKMDRIGRKIMEHMPLFYEYELYEDRAYETMLSNGSFFFSPKYRLVYKYEQDDTAVESDLFSEPKIRYYSYLSKQTVHMNQFIFHDSDASLTWLINNSPEFLEMLLTEAGYDENPRINEMVLAKRLEQLEGKPNYYTPYDFLFVAKDVNAGKLIIHEGLLKYIVASSTPEDSRYSCMLNAYGHLMVEDDDLGRRLRRRFTKEECYKIGAYLGYYETLARQKNNIDIPGESDHHPEHGWNGSFFRNQLGHNKRFLKALEDNNFYNLPELKEMVEGVMYRIEIDNMRADPDNYKPGKYYSK